MKESEITELLEIGMQGTEFEVRPNKVLKVLKETRDHTILRFRKQRGVGYDNEKKKKKVENCIIRLLCFRKTFWLLWQTQMSDHNEHVLSILFYNLTPINNNLKTT